MLARAIAKRRVVCVRVLSKVHVDDEDELPGMLDARGGERDFDIDTATKTLTSLLQQWRHHQDGIRPMLEEAYGNAVEEDAMYEQNSKIALLAETACTLEKFDEAVKILNEFNVENNSISIFAFKRLATVVARSLRRMSPVFYELYGHRVEETESPTTQESEEQDDIAPHLRRIIEDESLDPFADVVRRPFDFSQSHLMPLPPVYRKHEERFLKKALPAWKLKASLPILMAMFEKDCISRSLAKPHRSETVAIARSLVSTHMHVMECLHIGRHEIAMRVINGRLRQLRSDGSPFTALLVSEYFHYAGRMYERERLSDVEFAETVQLLRAGQAALERKGRQLPGELLDWLYHELEKRLNEAERLMSAASSDDNVPL
ncbi:MAG: hypothetical protein MHM6MM_003382 [Cercozoa sp. M6MM]